METKQKLECGSVRNWLARLNPSTARVYSFVFKRWLVWLETNGGRFSEMNPDELLAYQKATDNGSEYDILDTVQQYVLSMGNEYRYSYKVKPLITVRSFFVHNRSSTPVSHLLSTGEADGDDPFTAWQS